MVILLLLLKSTMMKLLHLLFLENGLNSLVSSVESRGKFLKVIMISSLVQYGIQVFIKTKIRNSVAFISLKGLRKRNSETCTYGSGMDGRTYISNCQDKGSPIEIM